MICCMLEVRMSQTDYRNSCYLQNKKRCEMICRCTFERANAGTKFCLSLKDNHVCCNHGKESQVPQWMAIEEFQMWLFKCTKHSMSSWDTSDITMIPACDQQHNKTEVPVIPMQQPRATVYQIRLSRLSHL